MVICYENENYGNGIALGESEVMGLKALQFLSWGVFHVLRKQILKLAPEMSKICKAVTVWQQVENLVISSHSEILIN